MATPPQNNPNTPRAGGIVSDVALQMAQGASVSSALIGSMKDASLTALLGPSTLFAGVMVGVLKTMKAIVEQSGILEQGLKRIASMQRVQGQFETLLKSASAAQQRIKELYDFVATSPFNMSDVAEGNRQLQALTRGALAGAEGMRLVGDTAAATGQSFAAVSADIGKLYASLRSGRSLERVLFLLQRDGVVTDELARKLELAKESGASFGEMWNVVVEQLGRTEGAMKNEMRTLEGLNKHMVEAGNLMQEAFAAPYVKVTAESIKTMTEATKNLTPLLATISKDTAPIYQAFASVKNSVINSTLATKGFADALGVAWTIAKGVALSIGAVAAGNLGVGLFSMGRAGTGLASKYAAGMKAPEAKGAMSKSSGLATQAATEFAEGSLMVAASLKAQSLWAALSTKVITLNTAAMAQAGKGTAAYSIVTHGASLAVGILTMGLGAMTAALRTALVAMGAFMATPIGAIAVAATAAGLAVQAWANKTVDAAKAQSDLVYKTAALNRELREQAKNIRTVEQLRDMEVRLSKEEGDAKKELAALGARPKVPEAGGSGVARRRMQAQADEWDEKARPIQERLGIIQKTRGDLPKENTLINEKSEELIALTIRQRIAQYELLIAGIKKRGGETAYMESRKELSVLQAQLALARERAKVHKEEGAVSVAELEAQIAQVEGRQAEFKKNAGIKRAVDDATIAGKPQQARAIQDNADLAKMKSEYVANGMTEAQATTDFGKSLMADAARQSPRIVADSLQSVGGGGGSAGTDPMLAAQMRMEKLGQVQTTYLEIIAKAVSKGGAGGIKGG